VSLIPVEFYAMQSSIRKSDGCDALQLAPFSAAICFAKKLPNFDARSSGNCFHILDRSDNIKFHYVILCLGSTNWQVQLTTLALSRERREKILYDWLNPHAPLGGCAVLCRLRLASPTFDLPSCKLSK